MPHLVVIISFFRYGQGVVPIPNALGAHTSTQTLSWVPYDPAITQSTTTQPATTREPFHTTLIRTWACKGTLQRRNGATSMAKLVTALARVELPLWATAVRSQGLAWREKP